MDFADDWTDRVQDTSEDGKEREAKIQGIVQRFLTSHYIVLKYAIIIWDYFVLFSLGGRRLGLMKSIKLN